MLVFCSFSPRFMRAFTASSSTAHPSEPDTGEDALPRIGTRPAWTSSLAAASLPSVLRLSKFSESVPSEPLRGKSSLLRTVSGFPCETSQPSNLAFFPWLRA